MIVFKPPPEKQGVLAVIRKCFADAIMAHLEQSKTPNTDMEARTLKAGMELDADWLSTPFIVDTNADSPLAVALQDGLKADNEALTKAIEKVSKDLELPPTAKAGHVTYLGADFSFDKAGGAQVFGKCVAARPLVGVVKEGCVYVQPKAWQFKAVRQIITCLGGTLIIALLSSQDCIANPDLPGWFSTAKSDRLSETDVFFFWRHAQACMSRSVCIRSSWARS